MVAQMVVRIADTNIENYAGSHFAQKKPPFRRLMLFFNFGILLTDVDDFLSGIPVRVNPLD